MQVSAYCGLTDYLTAENFFFPLCDKHHLLDEGVIYEEERAAVVAAGLDTNGSRASSMYQVWCFEVIRNEVYRSARDNISAPIHAQLKLEVNKVGDHVKKLFAYRFQVLPFIYTHLVSSASTLYLIFAAFAKGLYFTPDAYIGFGIVLPFCGVFMSVFTVFGLLEVGNTILDPFGSDPEDFALLHFVEYTLGASYEATRIKPCGPRRAERGGFYTVEETAAATLVCRRMVRRHRWFKTIDGVQARLAASKLAKGSFKKGPSSPSGSSLHDPPPSAHGQSAAQWLSGECGTMNGSATRCANGSGKVKFYCDGAAAAGSVKIVDEPNEASPPRTRTQKPRPRKKNHGSSPCLYTDSSMSA